MFRKREKGQSLIEVTFFLIILLIMVAGIVEVGAILQTKLTVVNSAREGARFGTVSPSDEDITLVTQSAAANIINFQDDNAEIWVIHAKTGEDGTISDGCPSVVERPGTASYWCVEHTLGGGDVAPPFVTKADLADTLLGVKNTEVVGVAISYDHQSIIGLPYAVGGGGMPVTSFTVMRVEASGASGSCQIWPIGVPYDYVEDLTEGDLMKDSVEGPNYHKGLKAEGGNHANFGWLSWDGQVNANALKGSMEHPLEGECLTYEHGSKEEQICYSNAADPTDHDLSVGDWVYNSTGWQQAVEGTIDAAMDGRYIRIVVWEMAKDAPEESATDFCHGQFCYYKVKGFAIIQVTDWYDYKHDQMGQDGDILTAGQAKALEARFIRFSTSCD